MYAFHKYWGKKPAEPISFLVENLTREDELVLDPFVGSGIVASEAARLGRRFIGIDLNPIAIEISKLLISPPEARAVAEGLDDIERHARRSIEESYKRGGTSEIATHYLWNDQMLQQIWVVRKGRRMYEPTEHDIRLFEQYVGYHSHHIRPLRFFANSRINASPHLTLNDLFTGRALRNIDLLLDASDNLTASIQPAFRLCLTAASGQMSNMVFAITRRGKRPLAQVEVGSWVIGYWRPALHFEINVWECFERRVYRLLRALKDWDASPRLLARYSDVLDGRAMGALCCGDALELLEQFPANSVDLILTDPPHSDRVPYLELNELWNAILGYTADFSKEIVVSDAQSRKKGGVEYNLAMQQFLALASRAVKPGHYVVLLFNARDVLSWEYLHLFLQKPGDGRVEYKGHFPLPYSAGSVVQDSREGGLKHDFALVFQKPVLRNEDIDRVCRLQCLAGWSSDFPKKARKDQ